MCVCVAALINKLEQLFICSASPLPLDKPTLIEAADLAVAIVIGVHGSTRLNHVL